MSLSQSTPKPMSKLKRRIQAAVATAPLEPSPNRQSVANLDGSTPMTIEEPNQDQIDLSLIKNFSFSNSSPNSLLVHSKFAEALPTSKNGANHDHLFSLPPEVFLQPCHPHAFQGPSPDDEVIIARRGTSLGASIRKS